MIKILKHGKKDPKFQLTCPFCKCEFEYEKSDLEDYHFIKCPDCGCTIDHDFCQIEKSKTDFIQPAYKPITLPDWATKQEDDPCKDCPSNPKYLKGTYVGDWPCDWCTHNHYKITFTSVDC